MIIVLATVSFRIVFFNHSQSPITKARAFSSDQLLNFIKKAITVEADREIPILQWTNTFPPASQAERMN